ncbi:hypothetical protein [Enhygromyxa salina]|uniref:Uncharacterized protein n=1 Tax=Enhygromyxa salina TaxID=215803 RepID=A0A2S9YNI8_9BACT|nr:hypothetical protein [Enhygromyxa salina]PRQ06648.1 hypothetical protein ENSA7_35240 [Enhygromyxa salina]
MLAVLQPMLATDNTRTKSGADAQTEAGEASEAGEEIDGAEPPVPVDQPEGE